MPRLKVLFVAEQPSYADSAAMRRLFVLKNGLESCGAQTNVLYLGDYFLSAPRILQPINIPRFLNVTNRYGVHTHGVVIAAAASAYVMGITKYLGNFTFICDVQAGLEESRILKRNFYDISYYYRRIFESIIEPIILNRSDYFVACSQRLKRDLIIKGIDKKKITVIRNGVDTEIFRPSNQKSASENFTVTYAGGFQKYQGIRNLLEAAHALKDTVVKFKIIGFKNTDFALKEGIRHSLGNKVELVNFLPQRKLVFLLQKSDVFVIPRSANVATEPAFPTKFAEYLAIGKPLIVTDVDETAELVRKHDCGFVCKPNVSSIVEAIMEARETPFARMKQMGENGRRLAETEFDQRVLGKAYFEFLSRIIESREQSSII
jgi:glycosyltransferase involved in cell wall biosynthesis